jgi:hypothetical protein
MDIDKFTDLNSLYHNFKKDSFKTYKGMLHLFNQKRLMTTPILNLTELQNSVIYVNGPEGKFGYTTEYEIDFPYSLGNVNDVLNTTLGIDGQKFKIHLSENCFNNTDIITYDLRDGITLYISEEEIIPEGDGYIYTVQIPQTGKRGVFFPIDKLKAGTQFMKITNVNGEHDTQKSGISYRTGKLDLEVQMGGHRSVSHWISGYADMLELSGDYGNYEKYGHALDMSKSNAVLLFANKDKVGNVDWKNAKWMKRIEALLFAEMKMMEENDLTWNKGGIVQGSGRRQVRVNTGLYEQMKNGNWFEYTKLTLGLIESAVSNMFYNSGIPFEERRTEVQVGTAAMIEVSKLLFDDFKRDNPFVVNAGDVNGYIFGTAMNLGFGVRFTTKRFPTAGMVTFKHNPAFDAKVGRTNDQKIGEFPLESHTLAIFDITDGNVSNAAAKWNDNKAQAADGFNNSSNIVLLKPKNWGDVYWGYKLGTQHPFGPNATKGMFNSDDRDGYGIWFKSFSSIWLKDAGRTMLLTKKRPGYLV